MRTQLFKRVSCTYIYLTECVDIAHDEPTLFSHNPCVIGVTDVLNMFKFDETKKDQILTLSNSY